MGPRDAEVCTSVRSPDLTSRSADWQLRLLTYTVQSQPWFIDCDACRPAPHRHMANAEGYRVLDRPGGGVATSRDSLSRHVHANPQTASCPVCSASGFEGLALRV